MPVSSCYDLFVEYFNDHAVILSLSLFSLVLRVSSTPFFSLPVFLALFISPSLFNLSPCPLISLSLTPPHTPPLPAKAAMSGAGGAAGGPGGVRHGALWERGTLWCWCRRNQPAAVAAPLLPAHLLCAVSVCKLPSHGAVLASKGMERTVTL